MVNSGVSTAFWPLSKLLRTNTTQPKHPWILFGSKFLILEIVDIVFGEHVELGKFLDVIVLVIALMVAREVFQWIYLAFGEREPEGIKSG